IEHLSNPGLALKHIREALVIGGHLIITTPNPRWSRSRIAALLSGFPNSFTQADLDYNRHIFPVWPHILKHLLNEAGFTVEQYATLDGVTHWPRLSSRYVISFAHAFACKLIEAVDRTACGMSYGMIAVKS